MWHLESYDKETEEGVGDYALTGVDESAVKELLKLYCDGFDEREFGPFMYPIRHDGLPKLEERAGEPLPKEDFLNYYVTFYDD